MAERRGSALRLSDREAIRTPGPGGGGHAGNLKCKMVARRQPPKSLTIRPHVSAERSGSCGEGFGGFRSGPDWSKIAGFEPPPRPRGRAPHGAPHYGADLADSLCAVERGDWLQAPTTTSIEQRGPRQAIQTPGSERPGRRADGEALPISIRPKSGPEARFTARKHYGLTKGSSGKLVRLL